MGAFTCCGTTLGILLGSGVGAAIAATMTTETLDAWGWRIPFLLELVVTQKKEPWQTRNGLSRPPLFLMNA